MSHTTQHLPNRMSVHCNSYEFNITSTEIQRTQLLASSTKQSLTVMLIKVHPLTDGDECGLPKRVSWWRKWVPHLSAFRIKLEEKEHSERVYSKEGGKELLTKSLSWITKVPKVATLFKDDYSPLFKWIIREKTVTEGFVFFIVYCKLQSSQLDRVISKVEVRKGREAGTTHRWFTEVVQFS